MHMRTCWLFHHRNVGHWTAYSRRQHHHWDYSSLEMVGSEFLNQQSNPAVRCIDGTMRREWFCLLPERLNGTISSSPSSLQAFPRWGEPNYPNASHCMQPSWQERRWSSESRIYQIRSPFLSLLQATSPFLMRTEVGVAKREQFCAFKAQI